MPPDPDIAPYHDRQIVILERNTWADWLDPSVSFNTRDHRGFGLIPNFYQVYRVPAWSAPNRHRIRADSFARMESPPTQG